MAQRRAQRRAAGAAQSYQSPSASGGTIPLWPGVAVGALVGLVYLAVASEGTFRFRPSRFPHHVLVADAWLHGQLNIRQEIIDQLNAPFYARQRHALEQRYRRPLTEAEWQQIKPRLKSSWMHDWSYFNGKYYGYWPPMPAVLMLPYAALAGLKASDMLVSCLIGAGSVFLMFMAVREANRHGFVPATAGLAAGLAVFFGLGTVHFYMSVLGQVWFFTQIVATFFFTLAMWCVLRCDRSWLWAAASGAALGASFLSRNSVVVMVPFFLFAILAVTKCLAMRRVADRQEGASKENPLPASRRGEGLGEGLRFAVRVLPVLPSWRRAFPLALAFCATLAIGGVGQLAFNHARFGSVREDGWAIQLTSGANPIFKRAYAEHGGLSLHYVPQNFYYYFINPKLRRLRDGAWSFDPFGNSMFLVSPALLYVFLSWRRRGLFTIGLWVGAGACMILLLLFLGTGWYNFGNRYLLDLMPLAVLLVGIGMRGRLTKVSWALIALSIAVNSWGTYRFTSEQF
jgi:hypothetical protein